MYTVPMVRNSKHKGSTSNNCYTPFLTPFTRDNINIELPKSSPLEVNHSINNLRDLFWNADIQSNEKKVE